MSELLHAVCPHCSAVNRLPGARVGEAPKCGQCHRPLYSGRPIELSGTTFQKHIDRNDVPVLVDFWAPWCGPCKMMAPEYERAAGELEPRVRLAKVNTESEPALGSRFNIRGIPTLALFVGGREVARHSGAMRAADIVRWVQSQL